MQFLSQACALVLLFALPCGCDRAKLLAGLRQTTTSAAWSSLAEAEADDRRFWRSQWAALEETLLQLTEATSTAEGVMALVQEHNHTKAEGAAKTAAALAGKQTTQAAGSKPNPAIAATAGNQTRGAAAAAPAKRTSPLAGLKLNLNPKSAADLMPALAMLKGLYEDGKERIAQLNEREKKSKQRFEEMQAAHEARLATIEARFKNHTLSAEFRTNETRDENRLWSYWQRVRENQHRQFHTSLKIQHGTMNKVKTMIDAYEKTISGGNANKAQAQKDLAKVAGVVPEVVLLQQACRASGRYFRQALEEVRAERADEQLGQGGHLQQ